MRVDAKSLVRRLNVVCTGVLQDIVARSVQLRHEEITVELFLLGLLELENSDITAIFHHFEKNRLRAVNQVEAAVQKMKSSGSARPVFSSRLWRWVQDAWLVASIERNASTLRTGDLLAQFCSQPGSYSGEIFGEIESISKLEIREKLLDITVASPEAPRDEPGVQKSSGDDDGPPRLERTSREALDRFTVSFTDRAREGKIDPIFGRSTEIRQMLDILARRRKNNPILVGDPGVGKTALVEGLAQAIAAGEVPESLRYTDLLGLDMGLLQAGAGVRGELERRIKQVIDEVKSSPTPIILFIDEAHTLVGTGGGEGSDVPNLLKPELARGELRTIAATTWSEYKKYFEKDPALARRFQLVKIDEPNTSDAILMLRGLREVFEKTHGVTIRDEAVNAAVALSDRYITGRQLPDKAIDLLDTAAARVKVDRDSPPSPLQHVRDSIAAVERELKALRRDHEEQHAENLEEVAAQLDQLVTRKEILEQEGVLLERRWHEEREQIAALEKLHRELRDAAVDEKLQHLEKLPGAKQALSNVQGESALIHAEVDHAAVARVVSDWTGIPVGRMKATTLEGLLDIESTLGARIKGQDDAIRTVAESVRMSYAGVRDPNTPIAVLLFVGPSGVGKTELATALAEELYGGARALITINMSEFQEKHTVSRLIGSPPGYVGYGEGGMLTEAVRQRPYSVVLLDECEKADLEVMNLFYQVFDKGLLTDGEGRAIDFKNTVIVLTSNLATDLTMSLHRDGQRPEAETLEESIRPLLIKHFKPALLGRMTIIPFRPLERNVLAEIIKLKLTRLTRRLQQTHGVEVIYKDSVINELLSRCQDTSAGARALDHILRKSLMPLLAKEMLQRMLAGTIPSQLAIGHSDAKGWSLDFSEDASQPEASP